ncbi:hypothetical protein TNCV_789901 [Trichonephila clavipes]|nr:hypothetical protein TNCV_789901 [Trichonephila clavipes]
MRTTPAGGMMHLHGEGSFTITLLGKNPSQSFVPFVEFLSPPAKKNVGSLFFLERVQYVDIHSTSFVKLTGSRKLTTPLQPREYLYVYNSLRSRPTMDRWLALSFKRFQRC